VDGASTVRLFGDEVAVRARIHTIGGLSAHGDQAALLGWLRGLKRPPRQTFLVHGERSTRQVFADVIAKELAWPDVRLPEVGDTFDA
jgi:metallo-beta-lactamase family protein